MRVKFKKGDVIRHKLFDREIAKILKADREFFPIYTILWDDGVVTNSVAQLVDKDFEIITRRTNIGF